MATAAVYWPVTGLNAGIDDLIDEYFFPYYGETPEEAFAKLGGEHAEAVAEAVQIAVVEHEQVGPAAADEGTGAASLTRTAPGR